MRNWVDVGQHVVAQRIARGMHLPLAVARGGDSRLFPVPPGSVHAQGGVEEPRHGGDETEGEDGAPDVANSGAPCETPDPGVPQATTPTGQLGTELASLHVIHPQWPLGARSHGPAWGDKTYIRQEPKGDDPHDEHDDVQREGPEGELEG